MIIFQISYFGPLMRFSLIFWNHQTKALSTAPFKTLRKNDGQLNRSYTVFISPVVWNMCENLHYESVYFKKLHNQQEYY